MHGIPDRLIVLPEGKVGFAEIKRPGGKTRKLQDKQINFLQKLGCYTMVIDSEEDISIFLGGLELWESQKHTKH